MTYSANDIQILEGINAVRKRPGMYIGDTTTKGLHHLIWEVLDNSIDEHLAGYGKEINIKVEDKTITIIDAGRGIPVDKHDSGKSALEVVMTTLHAGGKFDNKVYSISGGLHGVGASVVNALSEFCEVNVHKDGRQYCQKYEKGVPKTKLFIRGKSKLTGTTTTFKPDASIFDTTEFSLQTIEKKLKEITFLNSTLTIKLDFKGQKQTFRCKGGLKQYLQDETQEKALTPVFHFCDKINDKLQLELAFCWTTAYSDQIKSYVNNIHTSEGGTHETGFKSAITRFLNQNIKSKITFTGDDVREGLCAAIHVKIPDPQFEGQTKTKLGNSRVRIEIESWLMKNLMDQLKKHLKKIQNKLEFAAKARVAARKAKEVVRKNTSSVSSALAGKLAACQTRDPEKAELFIVEGDSAGGSAKQGRNRKIQAILPLKGKILNVEETGDDKTLNNKEIQSLIQSLGVGFGKEFDAEKCKYHKIIIMTDADVDGAHIRTLLLTFFYRKMKPLIEKGYLYISEPPLYRVKDSRKITYVKNEKEFEMFLIKRGLRLQDRKYSDFKPALEILKKMEELDRILYNQYGPFYPHLNELLNLSFNTGYDEKVYGACAEGFRKVGLGPNLEKVYYCTTPMNGLVIDYIYKKQPYSIHLTRNYVDPKLLRFELLLNKLKEVHEADESSWRTIIPDAVEAGKKSLTISRYKGLGEMTPNQLWETTMDPENRRICRVEIDDAESADKYFKILMGSNVKARKEFIEENATYSNIDL